MSKNINLQYREILPHQQNKRKSYKEVTYFVNISKKFSQKMKS